MFYICAMRALFFFGGKWTRLIDGEAVPGVEEACGGTAIRGYRGAVRPLRRLAAYQSGGKYSATSVQKIFRKAVKDSGINPWVTVP